jgi:hypothetical protein
MLFTYKPDNIKFIYPILYYFMSIDSLFSKSNIIMFVITIKYLCSKYYRLEFFDCIV